MRRGPPDLNILVMPGLVPGIQVFRSAKKDLDGRDKPGHDEFTSRGYFAATTMISTR
jgi:hypothetical protein